MGLPEVLANEIENEIRVIQKLRDRRGHGNIISVLDYGWLIAEQFYYIDMNLCDLSLRDFIRGAYKSKLEPRYLSPYSESDVLECLYFWSIGKQIVQGLEFIHDAGEVHRDIKPENGKSKIHPKQAIVAHFV